MSIKLSKYSRRTKIRGRMWDLCDGYATSEDANSEIGRLKKMITNEGKDFCVVKQSHIVGDPVFLIYRTYK